MGYNNINNLQGDMNAQRGDRLHSAAGNGVRADSGVTDTGTASLREDDDEEIYKFLESFF